jgi:hypothetical protein
LCDHLGNESLTANILDSADKALMEFYKGKFNKSSSDKVNFMDLAGPGMNIIKACSEALFFGVVSCFKNEMQAYKVIRDNLHPCAGFGYHFASSSKLLINLFTGGKASGSTVRFSRFYLIIDGWANPDCKIPVAYSKFVTALRKSFATVKGGETNFKIGVEGAYFNAFSTIAETFKQIEDAIT